jgi:hypothetical protein
VIANVSFWRSFYQITPNLNQKAIASIINASNTQAIASYLLLTAIIDQTNHKKIFESVALQHFQKFSWFGFERKAL